MSDIRDARQGSWGWYQYDLLDKYGAQLRPAAIATYIALTRFANNQTQTTRPAAERIAGVTGLSVRQVRRELARLVEFGLVLSKPRYDADGRQLTNEYILMDLQQVVGRGDTQSPLGVTHSQGEGDTQSPKQDYVEQDYLEQESTPAQAMRDISHEAPVPAGTYIKLRKDLPPVRPVPKPSDDPAVSALLDELRTIYPFRDGKVARPALAKRALAGLSPADRERLKLAARNYAASRDGQDGYAKDLHTWIELDEWREYLTPATPRPVKVAAATGPAPRPYTVITRGA